MINWLFDVKTEDRAACVTQEIFEGKNPSVAGGREHTRHWLLCSSGTVWAQRQNILNCELFIVPVWFEICHENTSLISYSTNDG